jgi:MFS family permease
MNEDLITKVQKEVAHEQKSRDGIPQIAVGIFMLTAALFLLADKTSFVAIYIVFIPLLIEHLRKKYTYPRIGYAKLREKISRRSGLMWLILALLIAGAAVFVVVQKVDIAPKVWAKLHYAVMIIIGVIVLSFMLFRYIRERNKAMLIYGSFILLFVASVLTFKLHLETVYQILAGLGIFNLVYGIIVLKKFIREYPILDKEE